MCQILTGGKQAKKVLSTKLKHLPRRLKNVLLSLSATTQNSVFPPPRPFSHADWNPINAAQSFQLISFPPGLSFHPPPPNTLSWANDLEKKGVVNTSTLCWVKILFSTALFFFFVYFFYVNAKRVVGGPNMQNLSEAVEKKGEGCPRRKERKTHVGYGNCQRGDCDRTCWRSNFGSGEKFGNAIVAGQSNWGLIRMGWTIALAKAQANWIAKSCGPRL